jgi:hypothetical protein
MGMKADTFGGMNKTQLFVGVLNKFAAYYSDTDGYTNGCGTDCYKRNLLQNWDDKPFVQGTYSEPNEAFGGHRAYTWHWLFVAGEAFQVPLLEFCSVPPTSD